MGSKVQWDHNYETEDISYSVYTAPDAAMIREHARQAGLRPLLGFQILASWESNFERLKTGRSKRQWEVDLQ